jgi:hypothetical protein
LPLSTDAVVLDILEVCKSSAGSATQFPLINGWLAGWEWLWMRRARTFLPTLGFNKPTSYRPYNPNFSVGFHEF